MRNAAGADTPAPAAFLDLRKLFTEDQTMTNQTQPAQPANHHRTAAAGHLSAVQASHQLLNQLYAKEPKHTSDWTKISELKVLIKCGYEAAQVHATIYAGDAVRELTQQLQGTPPAQRGRAAAPARTTCYCGMVELGGNAQAMLGTVVHGRDDCGDGFTKDEARAVPAGTDGWPAVTQPGSVRGTRQDQLL